MSGRRRRPRGAAARAPAPATRHEHQALLIGHTRGAAGRLMGTLRMDTIDTGAMRREVVEQLELARQDVELALMFARLLAAARPDRR